MPESAITCPCGSPQSYIDHCAKVHGSGAGLGVSAESLMRARYCAYVLGLADFLHESWHLTTRGPEVIFDDTIAWLGLEIVETVAGSAFDSDGIVEFKARFRRGTEYLELHERSSFVRVDGRWMYLQGE